MARRSARRAASPLPYIAGGLVIVGGASVALWLLTQRRSAPVSQPDPQTAPPPGPSPDGTQKPAAPASAPTTPAPSGPTPAPEPFGPAEDDDRATPAPEPTGPRLRADVLQRLDRYTAAFDQASKDTGIPAAWLKGIAAAESSGNADSGKGTTGYKGLMQARRDVGQLVAAESIKTGAAKLRDFKASVQKHMGATFSSIAPAEQLRVLATAYNAGPGTVYKALDYARDAGDAARWRAPEHYTRALIFYGAYSTRAYAPKGTPQAEIDAAERWRLDSRSKGLTLAELQQTGAPAIVVRAIEQKAAHTAPYLDKIAAYAAHYSAPAVA